MSSVKELVGQVKEYIDKYVDIPTIDELDDELPMSNLHRATNDMLKEYLETYGSYKASLETKLAAIESNLGMMKSLYDRKLEQGMSDLSKNREKRITKDFARGQAISDNEELQNLANELDLINAIFIRVRGMKESYATAYNTVSRMIALKDGHSDKSF